MKDNLKKIKQLRLFRDLILIFSIFYFMRFNNSNYAIFIVLGINWFLSSLIPYEYRGGIRNDQKNLFFKNISPKIENCLISLFIFGIIGFILFL